MPGPLTHWWPSTGWGLEPHHLKGCGAASSGAQGAARRSAANCAITEPAFTCAGLTKAAVEARGRSRQSFRVDPPSGTAKLDLMPLFWIDAGALSEQAALRLATPGIASSLPAMENTMALDGPPAPFLKSLWSLKAYGKTGSTHLQIRVPTLSLARKSGSIAAHIMTLEDGKPRSFFDSRAAKQKISREVLFKYAASIIEKYSNYNKQIYEIKSCA